MHIPKNPTVFSKDIRHLEGRIFGRKYFMMPNDNFKPKNRVFGPVKRQGMIFLRGRQIR